MSQNRRIVWHLSPTEEFQAFLLHNDFKHFLCLVFLQFILWEKEHSDTVFSFLSDGNAKRLCDLLKKFVRNLRQNSDTVTGFTFCILSCTMLQIFHDLKCIFHCLMTFYALNIDAGSDATIIMLKFLTMERRFRTSHLYIKHVSSSLLIPLVQVISSLIFILRGAHPTRSAFCAIRHTKRSQRALNSLLCDLCVYYTPNLICCKQLFF